MLIGCCRPVTLGSLLSWPSIMKLFDRVRMPFTEKFGAGAKRAWPLLSWLTPGGLRGRGEHVARVAAPAAQRCAVVEAHADLGIRRVQQGRIGLDRDRLRDRRRLQGDVDHGVLVQGQRHARAHDLANPLSSAVTWYARREGSRAETAAGVGDRRANEVGVDVANGDGGAGMTPPCSSVTTPWIEPVIDCAGSGGKAPRMQTKEPGPACASSCSAWSTLLSPIRSTTTGTWHRQCPNRLSPRTRTGYSKHRACPAGKGTALRLRLYKSRWLSRLEPIGPGRRPPQSSGLHFAPIFWMEDPDGTLPRCRGLEPAAYAARMASTGFRREARGAG